MGAKPDFLAKCYEDISRFIAFSVSDKDWVVFSPNLAEMK